MLTEVLNFLHCGISAKIAEMTYNAENNILNKNEKKKPCLKIPQNKIYRYLLNTTR